MKLQYMFDNYKRKILPPYSKKDYPAIAITLLLLLFIPLTMIFLNEQFLTRSSASGTASIEPENSSLSQNAQMVTDSQASGGKYVKITLGSSTISGTTYYVDCQGSDTNNGTSENSAWKTLGKASAVNLNAGDGLLLKRGCVFSGQTLTAGWTGTSTQPVVISAYGTGDLPIIESNVNNARIINFTGSYITAENLYTRAIPPSTEAGCSNNPKGYIIGFQLDSSSHHITVKNSKATGAYAGVYIRAGSNNNRILSNTLENNTMMNPLDVGGSGDAGAFGVLLHGDDNEVANNTISGHDACSYDYGRDGAAVELYGGSRNKIHHNTASQNDHFSELGKSSSDTSATDNVYAYNVYTSTLTDSVFLNTRGEGHTYGPIYNTKAYNNSIYLTGSNSQGVVCSNCGTSILTLRNNILWANWKSIYASTSFNESNNIYWKSGGSPTVQGFTPSSTSKITNPLYVNPASDLHLQSNSPALNAGSQESVTSGFTTDLDGKSVPNGAAPEIGAYEI